MASREEMSRSFGAVAGAYEAGRPDYPSEAVEWMLEPVLGAGARPRVIDVGAGTGKLTRVVAGLGADVVAVDPDPGMLAELAARVPGVPVFEGTGEQLPLPSGTADAVVFGQAWHWVDVPTASTEVGRVLRPGGVIGLIWNVRDDRDEWVRRLTDVMHGSAAETLIAEGGPEVREPFDGLERRAWEWTRSMGRDELLAMVTSRSYVITATAERRAEILAGVGDLFDERAAGASTVDVPYRTEAFRGVRP